MKKLNFILLICIFFLFPSCKGQNPDLEKLPLPVKIDELKTLELSNSGAGTGTQQVQYTSYVPDTDQSISFGGIEIPKSKAGFQSTIYLYSKDEGKSFQGYTLNLFTSDSFEKILKYLSGNKSKFRLVFDNGKDSEERARVFISAQEGITYLLLSRPDNEGRKHGYLDKISKNEEALLSARTGGAFGYYGEFLEYKKNKPAHFTYLDFLRERNSEIYNKENNLKR